MISFRTMSQNLIFVVLWGFTAFSVCLLVCYPHRRDRISHATRQTHKFPRVQNSRVISNAYDPRPSGPARLCDLYQQNTRFWICIFVDCSGALSVDEWCCGRVLPKLSVSRFQKQRKGILKNVAQKAQKSWKLISSDHGKVAKGPNPLPNEFCTVPNDDSRWESSNRESSSKIEKRQLEL